MKLDLSNDEIFMLASAGLFILLGLGLLAWERRLDAQALGWIGNPAWELTYRWSRRILCAMALLGFALTCVPRSPPWRALLNSELYVMAVLAPIMVAAAIVIVMPFGTWAAALIRHETVAHAPFVARLVSGIVVSAAAAIYSLSSLLHHTLWGRMF